MSTAAVDDLRISVALFVDPEPVQVATTATVAGQDNPKAAIAVPGLGAVDLTISAQLLLAGTCSSGG